MAEVLSQSQIDALLNSMQNQPDKEKSTDTKKEVSEYRKYDFYSPKKFTKDKLKLIKSIYDGYSRMVSSQLNGIMRTGVEIEVIGVEEQRYHEFSNALGDGDVMMLLDIKLPDLSKNPPMLAHINTNLMLNMIDRMLGGVGNSEDVDADYMYTEIELTLYSKIMEYILGVTDEAWNNYIKFEIGEPRKAENTALFREISFDEPVAIVMLKAKLLHIEGTINICIPGNLLTSIFNIMDRKKHYDGMYENTTKRDKMIIMDKIKYSPLTVRATLADAKLSAKDICSLKVGDVIDLDKSKDSHVSLYVNEEPWFEGRLGVHNKNVAVKINRRLDNENEEEYSVINKSSL